MTIAKKFSFHRLLFLWLLSTNSSSAQDITLFAAASLTQPIKQITDQYYAQTGIKIITVFAASSTLARQIAYGAPADIYISANQKWMRYLLSQEKVQPSSLSTLLYNRLVLIAPNSSNLAAIDLTRPQITLPLTAQQKLATGNTDHVPVGIYAKQALIHLQLWDQVKHKLALTANTRGALAFAERAVVPLAIVYKTDALFSKKVKILATFASNSHQEIQYPLALITREQPTSAASLDFFHYLKSLTATAIFEKFGFATKGLAD